MSVKTHCIIPLWGQKHIDHFIEWCAPSLLRNLPLISDSELIIYTRNCDAHRLGGFTINAIEDDEFWGHPGTVMTAMHQLGIERAMSAGAGVMPLVGDMIFGDGSFAEVQRHIVNGARAVMMSGVGMPHDRYELCSSPGKIESCKSLSMMKMCVGNPPDPISFYPSPAHPAAIQWRGGFHGFLERRFHLQPIWINPRKPYKIKWSVDNDLLANSGIAMSEIAYLDDCMKFYCLSPEISDGGNPHKNVVGDGSQEYVAKWARQWTDSFTRQFFRHKFWTHDGELDPSVKAWVEAESDAIVDGILRMT